ncbi:MAG TPA: FliM/FliN family flagellar motor switch protein [Tepidisphaeraceae bacterium]|nr:FliM/FliN family flagellar motor switch protein [Tepidisphaeraceae bacterium]
MAVLNSQASNGAPAANDVERILKIGVPVIVKLAERRMRMSEVLRLSPGSILEFSKPSEDQLELMINNRTIGLGVAVKVGENFGIRLSQVGDVKELIASMKA